MKKMLVIVLLIGLGIQYAEAGLRYTPEGYYSSQCRRFYHSRKEKIAHKLCTFCSRFGAAIYTTKKRWPRPGDARWIVKKPSDRPACAQGIKIFLKYNHHYAEPKRSAPGKRKRRETAKSAPAVTSSGIVSSKSERTRVDSEKGIVIRVCYSVRNPITLVWKNGSWTHPYTKKSRKRPAVGTILDQKKYDGPNRGYRQEVVDHFTLNFKPTTQAGHPTKRLFAVLKMTEWIEIDHFDKLQRYCAKKFSCNCGGKHRAQYGESYDSPEELKKDFLKTWKKSYARIGRVSFDDEE